VSRAAAVVATLLAAFALVTATPRPAAAQATHRAEQRAAHIREALAAVEESSPEALRQASEYARVFARGGCSSSVQRLRVECMMTAARRYCHKKGAGELSRCQASMDVIVSNLLGEAQLIPTDKRYQIMSHHKDYRAELARELKRIQGALAIDFRLQTGAAADEARLAQQIDQYCLTAADDSNMAWPTCVSSLVWFIGTERGTPPSSSSSLGSHE
jgi:hypothetical protein